MAISIAQQMYHHSLRKDDKGSIVNKSKCAASHFKNDVKYDLLASTVATAGVGAGILVYKKPQIGVTAMKSAGKVVSGFGKLLNKFKPIKFGTALEKYGTTIAGKASKYGKVGAIAAVAFGTLGVLAGLATKHAYNEGRIEQKYVDNAKIEKMTGSIVV